MVDRHIGDHTEHGAPESRDSASRNADSIDGKLERAKDAALGPHHGHATVSDEVGEAVGGISGVLLGAGIGSAAGPVGMVVGGVAGAIGGWWAGRAVSEAAERLSLEDDEYYRRHFESLSPPLADRTYEHVRAAYYLGQIASENPEYANQDFAAAEPELQRGWLTYADHPGDWLAVRRFAAEGFRRGRGRHRPHR